MIEFIRFHSRFWFILWFYQVSNFIFLYLCHLTLLVLHMYRWKQWVIFPLSPPIIFEYLIWTSWYPVKMYIFSWKKIILRYSHNWKERHINMPSLLIIHDLTFFKIRLSKTVIFIFKRYEDSCIRSVHFTLSRRNLMAFTCSFKDLVKLLSEVSTLPSMQKVNSIWNMAPATENIQNNLI